MPNMPSMPGNRPSSHKLRRSDSSGGAGLLTMILLIISLTVFTMSAREGGTGFFTSVRNITQTIVSPLRMAGAGIVSPFAGLGNVFRNLTADEKSLSELTEENEMLLARNVELEEAEVTARQLQELLDLRSSYNLQSTAARVIAGSTDSWTSTITIDKGTAAGIGIGMPVADSTGAIGQVIECSATTSTVRLLSDENSSVSAMIQKSRAQGMLEGSPDGTLHLSFIRTDQTVDPGEIVVTSGLGGVFPKGLPLGKIASVESSPGSTYYDIVIEPYSIASHLEEVLVITSLTEEQQATSEDIDSADAADLSAASGGTVSQSSKKSTDEDDDESTSSSASNEDADDEEGQQSSDEGTTSASTSSSSSSKSSTAKDSDSTDTDAESEETVGYVSPHSV